MKYTPGLIVGQLSGKAGSTVASRNKAGSYIKTKTTPKLVRNEATEAVRSSLATISSAWRALTDAQRLGWATLGASMSRTDSLGNSYTLTGSQAHETVNRNLFTVGLAYVSDAPALDVPAAPADASPTVPVPVAPGSTTVSATSTGTTLTVLDNTGLALGARILIGSPPSARHVTSLPDTVTVGVDSAISVASPDAVTWAAQTTIQLAFSPTPVATDTYLVVSASPGISAGITRPGAGIFRTVTILDPAETSAANISGVYTDRFGVVGAGSKIFTRCYLINAAGFASQRVDSSNIAVAP